MRFQLRHLEWDVAGAGTTIGRTVRRQRKPSRANGINISCERGPYPSFLCGQSGWIQRLDSVREYGVDARPSEAVNVEAGRSVTQPAPTLLTALRRPSPAAGTPALDKSTPRRSSLMASALATESRPVLREFRRKPALKDQSASPSY